MYTEKCGAMLLLFTMLYSQIIVASTDRTCDTSDWKCHNEFFVTGGYTFDHALYNSNQLSVALPDGEINNYTPKSAFPNNLNAMRFGFGSGLGNNSQFSYIMDYTQLFSQSKKGSELQFTRASKVFSSVLVYTLNPESRVRIGLVGGLFIASTYLTMSTVSQIKPYSVTTNLVDIDPLLGVDIIYQINSKVAVRLVEFLDIASYNRDASGSLATLIMLNYYPGSA